jgi:hypothetical protein
MVAIVVALAVPISQLPTVLILKSCCCPDPDDCHCPDHPAHPDDDSQPAMRACHNTQRAVVASQLPAFDSPAVAVVSVRPIVAVAANRTLPAPHQAPPPARPDAPS